MDEATREDASRCLTRLGDGDTAAASELMPLIYEELRNLASGFLRRERQDHTLQPTALVNEAYLKLFSHGKPRWNDRAHFLALSANAMRRILVDYARKHRASKRDGGQKMSIDMAAEVPETQDVDAGHLDEALKRLAKLSERQSRVVELRFFGGMNVKEVAHVLGVSARTVTGDWLVARAWLLKELDEDIAE